MSSKCLLHGRRNLHHEHTGCGFIVLPLVESIVERVNFITVKAGIIV